MRRLVSGGGWLMALLILTGACYGEAQRFALVVGVKEYTASEKLTKLPYAEQDASKLAEVLAKTGYEVTLMTQTASEGENRRRLAPTATQLRQEFELLVKTPALQKTDCVVVTLAGHGIQLPSKSNPKQTAYYFCPADARIDDLEFLEDVQPQHNLISVDEFYSTLKTCRAGVRLLVVDACRNDPNKVDNFRSGNSITRPVVPIPPGGIAAMFSCSANERAVEDAGLQHGVFSHYLIEALSGNADTDKDGELTIGEIQNYVGQRTFNFVRKNYGRQQLPELTGTIQGWAAVASLSPVKPAPMPTPTPNPMPLPSLDKFAAGTKAGEVRTIGGINFCWCPPGKFKMGEAPSAVDVTLTQGFYLGQYEVTQAEWETIMTTTPWKDKYSVKEGSDYPATFVSWEGASEFCTKLTAKGHNENWLPLDWKFDLPTEARWEYACRAGTETAYSFGDGESMLSEHAWFGLTEFGSSKRHPYQKGQKKPNPWKLYDIHGNISEWCRDRYAAELPGGTDPKVVAQVAERVCRGGSWLSKGENCRSAHRVPYSLVEQTPYLGFRLAVVPKH